MKKTLLIAAAAMAAVSASADNFVYDFYTNPAFCAVLTAEDGPSGGGNYDFIDKYGNTVNQEGFQIIVKPEGAAKGAPVLGLAISLVDGKLYRLSEDVVLEDPSIEVITPELYNQPFISWGEKGVTRTLLMTGWGSTDAWVDDNYNGATEADWVATKNGLAFNRIGTLDMVSRNDTYVQFPAVTGNVTIKLWAGTASDKSSKEQPLKVLITPVIDGVAAPEQAIEVNKDFGTFPEKRMIKLDPVNFDATGKNVAFQIGCNGAVLHLYHVEIEGQPASAGIEDIIASPVEDENAPVYNVLGQRVNENYKGLVIKNGKKFVQK